MNIGEANNYFNSFDLRALPRDFKNAVKKTLLVLETATGVGLGHLSLTRKVKSVSAGEYQRLLLLKHLSYEGTGSLFIFDEPSLGLNDQEKGKLFSGFKNLIDQGNTIFVIDHSEFFHKKSDRFVVVGPRPESRGEKLFSMANTLTIRKSAYSSPTSSPLEVAKRKFIEVIRPEVYGKECSPTLSFL